VLRACRRFREWCDSGERDGGWRGGGGETEEACYNGVAWLLQVSRVVQQWRTSGRVGVGDVVRRRQVDRGGVTVGVRCSGYDMVRVREEKKLGLGFLYVWRREGDDVED